MKSIIYSVPSIHCNHCVHTIQSEVSELEGVKSVMVNLESKKVEIIFDEPASDQKIKELLVEINYPATE